MSSKFNGALGVPAQGSVSCLLLEDFPAPISKPLLILRSHRSRVLTTVPTQSETAGPRRGAMAEFLGFMKSEFRPHEAGHAGRIVIVAGKSALRLGSGWTGYARPDKKRTLGHATNYASKG